MSLPKRYNPRTIEPQLQKKWEELGVYRFVRDQGPVYSIDTPPATVSGNLHMGHVYSYSHPDFLARFWRMNGYNVFYPMGHDDNGLPTGRLVEKLTGLSAHNVDRAEFAAQCEAVGAEYGAAYEALWKRLGLSVDWQHTYRTIGQRAQQVSQHSFVELYERGLVERREAPTIWCPECRTAIAQAELDDLERETTFYQLAFQLPGGATLPIATTRPELLPACVAVFVHPGDKRYRSLQGKEVTVPIFGQCVPILVDSAADPTKGTGAVMCCTFGDVTDVTLWHTHKLPLVQAIDGRGRLTGPAGAYAGLSVHQGRQQIVHQLRESGLLLDTAPSEHTVRVHERCDTPAEYVVTLQWFLSVLEYKQELLDAAGSIDWRPAYMRTRYEQWVENLGWDWCLSRQRAFGVPFPAWHCRACGETVLPDKMSLPVDPRTSAPPRACLCGSSDLVADTDVMDTWATSSLSPQIAGRWLDDPDLYAQIFPMSVRPQAHDIVRTWAFYTIVKSLHHFGRVPWREIDISGWGIAGQGMGKISKSRGAGVAAPAEMIERYSADALRYWAASTGLGKDAVISEARIQVGQKMVTKLWNVARFAQRFLADFQPPQEAPTLSPADRWILSRSQTTIQRVTAYMRNSDYAAAKSDIETHFWTELADNFLEMAKLRLYDPQHPLQPGASYALHHSLLVTIKLLAPFMPHVTERIYLELFAHLERRRSVHLSSWPVAAPSLQDSLWERTGARLVAVATTVRRFKSEQSLSLSTELASLRIVCRDPDPVPELRAARDDLASITRAQQIHVECGNLAENVHAKQVDRGLWVEIDR